MPTSTGLRRRSPARARLAAAAALTAVITSAPSLVGAPPDVVPRPRETSSIAPDPPSARSQPRDSPLIPISTTRGRRDRLVGELRKLLVPGERGVFLLAGAAETPLSEFRQSADFLYLTGLEAPGAFMLIAFDASRFAERLYLVPITPERERWKGVTLGPGRADASGGEPDPDRLRAAELTGFRGDGSTDGSGIAETGDLKADLRDSLDGPVVLFLRAPASGPGESPSAEEARTAEARAANPEVRVASAAGAIERLRLVKSAEEIELTRRAAAITCEAHRAAMRAVRPGVKEYEVEAAIEYVFTRSGARFSAFPPMVGSGPNTCVLHYTRNDRTIREGDLVLIDAGAEYGRYASDVTRTVPATGRFSPDQIEVYRAVLRAQDQAAALVRPGSRIREIYDRAKKVLEKEGFKDRIQHGGSHFVGLDVHDVGGPDVVLAPGMLLTVEPGVYIPEREIGVRIEDLFLVTEGGAEKISSCVPSAPGEIEALMAGRPGGPALSPDASAFPPR